MHRLRGVWRHEDGRKACLYRPWNLGLRDAAGKEAVTKAMACCNGNIARAADLLGIARPTLYSLLDKFGLRKASESNTDTL